MKRSMTWIAALVWILSAAAAAQDYVGAWRANAPGKSFVLRLNADGASELAGRPGRYRVNGAVLEWQTAQGVLRYGIQVRGDVMVLTGGDLAQPLTFTRVRGGGINAAAPTPAAAGPSLPPFDTFQAGATRFGYPRGWKVAPWQNGYVISEKGQGMAGPCLLLMGGALGQAPNNAQALTAAMLNALRATMPGLTAVGQDHPPHWPRIVRTRLTFAAGQTPFEATTYVDAAGGSYLFAMFSAPKSRAGEFSPDAMLTCLMGPCYQMQPAQARALAQRFLTPGSAAAPAAQPTAGRPQPAAAGSPAAAITDRWFLPAGKTLRGFYGGFIFRKTLRSHMTTSAVPNPATGYTQTSHAETGGDFRVALYTDGTIRAKLIVANWGPMVSYNVPLRYVGAYQLTPQGQFRTTEMPCTADRPTYRKFEVLMAKMRMSGVYDAKTDTLRVHVETFNAKQGRWWSKGQKILSRPVQRRQYLFGTQANPGGGQTWMGGRR